MKHPPSLCTSVALFFVFLFLATNAASTDEATDKLTDDKIEALKKWFHENNGRISQKIEMRRVDPSDPTSRFGFFAKSLIQRKEFLISVPREIILVADERDDELIDSAMPCETVQKLIREMRLGTESKFFPYIDYLQQQPHGILPSAWSEAGKNLLSKVIGKLPPFDSTSWLDYEWYRECKGGHDPMEENAAMLVISRGWDYYLVPVFDMMNHRNGAFLNTDSNSIYDNNKQAITVRATQRIQPGQELYTSYNFCRDCGGRVDDYGTPDILRDYGFVEDFPQRWIFHDTIKFDLEQKNEKTGDLKVNWIGTRSRRKGAEFFNAELNRILKVSKGVLKSATKKKEDDRNYVPPQELAVIMQYKDALETALQAALDSINGIDFDKCISEPETCDHSSDDYESFESDVDEVDYEDDVCDNEEIMMFKSYTWNVEVRTQYQELYFKHNPKTEDTCLDIGDTVQICTNYRPHYHEIMTHYPARFIDDVKRVLWVGGGDSMLLHEILKYPNIELAAGLEIDQTVTRGSFMHFGTQPHFDDDRVEWWYGDATKTLLMLPKDYFGSFDMVLVDLSETVMSMSVTEHMDVFEALSLLLKPDGIMVKNEFYFPLMKDVFDYTIEFYLHDVPVICAQAMSVSSNQIDFIHRDLKDHGVETVLLDSLQHNKDGFELIHHYTRNVTGVQRERVGFFESYREEPTEQTGSPGLLMIVEVEERTVRFKSKEELCEAILQALEHNDFEVSVTVINSFDEMGIFVLKEGFVIVRDWSEHNYCALDIHLWSNFNNHMNLRNILVKAVGGETKFTSTFRIVAGGMFGIDTWKSDYMNKGPVAFGGFPEYAHVTPSKEAIAVGDADIMVSEGLSLIRDHDAAVVVLCGSKDKACKSVDIIKESGNVGEILPLYSCQDLDDSTKYDLMEDDIKFQCEIETLRTLRKTVRLQSMKFRAIILDDNATISMAQIIFSIFSRLQNELVPDELVVMAIKNDESESWKRNFVEKFRSKIIIEEPVFRGEVLFNSTDSSIEMNVMSSGDNKFLPKLLKTVSNIETRTGLVGEIRKVVGGTAYYQPDSIMTKYYHHKDYDQKPSLAQWKSQHQVGHQTVMQLEIPKTKDNSLSFEFLKKAVEQSYLDTMSYSVHDGITTVSDTGDGCLFVGLWSKGSIVILWDGRAHVDINTYVDGNSDKIAKFFYEELTSRIEYLEMTMKDPFPRGFGRVINFNDDFDAEPREIPTWAQHIVEGKNE